MWRTERKKNSLSDLWDYIKRSNTNGVLEGDEKLDNSNI